jgi:hypothetical protein
MDIYGWRGDPDLNRKFGKIGPPSMLPEDTRPKVRKKRQLSAALLGG